MITLLFIAALLVVFVGSVVVMYNGLIVTRNRYKNAFAQIKVQLKRRHDLIPNLIETAKGYMAHEKGTLEEVIKARNAVHEASEAIEGGAPDGISMLAGAEKLLKKSMGGFFALAENYPDLKANTTMVSLMEELSSTENKIAFARQSFNDSVTAYNTKCELFPTNIVAAVFNFNQESLLEIDEADEEPVEVKF